MIAKDAIAAPKKLPNYDAAENIGSPGKNPDGIRVVTNADWQNAKTAANISIKKPRYVRRAVTNRVVSPAFKGIFAEKAPAMFARLNV